MSYDLLRSLYHAHASNAELTSPEELAALHVRTPLDDYIPKVVSAGRDVVLTGNPGDGKTHLVRKLTADGALRDASVELDLSARPNERVAKAWRQAAEAGKPYVLCGNEGPLLELLDELEGGGKVLRTRAREVRRQLGNLTVPREEDLPAPPEEAEVIDLDDRSVLTPSLIEEALSRVCQPKFLPPLGPRSTEATPGQNLMMLNRSEEIRRRLAAVIASAGQRCGEHVSFRQLWATIAYAITAGKAVSTLRVELSKGVNGLTATPFQNLSRLKTVGALLQAVRSFGDPAQVPLPGLDEEIWAYGAPLEGRWLFSVPSTGLSGAAEPPARIWQDVQRRGEAISLFAQIKRLVALAHEKGEAIIERLCNDCGEAAAEQQLDLSEVLAGLRRLYLATPEESIAPEWLRRGLPLWISNTYRDVPNPERVFASVTSLPESSFSLLKPIRAPWLAEARALGPLPRVTWLQHSSGVSLRLDPQLVRLLGSAAMTVGPAPLPDRVQGFMNRLAGHIEEGESFQLAERRFAVLARPRGDLIAEGVVRPSDEGGASYG